MISREDSERFDRDGVVCLRNRFEAKWIESLARGFEGNLAAPGTYATSYTPEGNPGGYLDDLMNWNRIPEYRSFVLESPAARIAGELTGSATCRIFLENMLIKLPGTREASPWHQDQPYYCVEGDKLCSVWLPLDPISGKTCVEFIAGSHRWGKLFTPIKFGDHSPYAYPPGTFDAPPDIDAASDRYEILSWDMEPGDCLVFHMRTVHRAPATSDLTAARRAFSTRWLGDDAVYVERPGVTFPDLPSPRPKSGEPLEHPGFPIVWRRNRGAVHPAGRAAIWKSRLRTETDRESMSDDQVASGRRTAGSVP